MLNYFKFLSAYYDNTIFHRVVPGFIVQGGDPTGTGTGGESIYGAPFKVKPNFYCFYLQISLDCLIKNDCAPHEKNAFHISAQNLVPITCLGLYRLRAALPPSSILSCLIANFYARLNSGGAAGGHEKNVSQKKNYIT